MNVAHVQFRSTGPDAFQLLVDGVDISKSTSIDNFSITIEQGRPMLTLKIETDELDVDLPDAVMNAETAPTEVGPGWDGAA